MSDIQKCNGIHKNEYGQLLACGIRFTCYRYTSPENKLNQAWGNPAHDFNSIDGCGLYWDTENE